MAFSRAAPNPRFKTYNLAPPRSELSTWFKCLQCLYWNEKAKAPARPRPSQSRQIKLPPHPRQTSDLNTNTHKTFTLINNKAGEFVETLFGISFERVIVVTLIAAFCVFIRQRSKHRVRLHLGASNRIYWIYKNNERGCVKKTKQHSARMILIGSR